jgi:hypothetical protein
VGHTLLKGGMLSFQELFKKNCIYAQTIIEEMMIYIILGGHDVATLENPCSIVFSMCLLQQRSKLKEVEDLTA